MPLLLAVVALAVIAAAAAVFLGSSGRDGRVGGAGSPPALSTPTAATGSAVSAPAVSPSVSDGPQATPQTASPAASAPAATEPVPNESPSPPPSAPPATPAPSATPVVVALNGVLLPGGESERASRQPIAVMIDDQREARPQSGLAKADLVYHAPAEGGIPRYMAVYQAGEPESVGPVRSSRLYYIGWAAEWDAMYLHHGGSPNSLRFLRRVGDGQLVYNADGFRWEGAGFLTRTRSKVAPHNLYITGKKLRQLAKRIDADATVDRPAWTFTDELPREQRADGGRLVVPYQYNRVRYVYDPETNRYVRSVTGADPQRDEAERTVIAPANVIVQFVKVGRLVDTGSERTNEAKGRLELGYIGNGRALVLRNGEVIEARWSKASDADPTLWTYASGPEEGQPVPLVRGQIFVQVVPTDMKVTARVGAGVPGPTASGDPGASPSGSPSASSRPSPSAP